MKTTNFRFASQLLLLATSLCLAACQTSGPLPPPSGLPSNPNVRINDLVVNQERESWLAQPLGTSVKYRGRVSFKDENVTKGIGTYEARLADVGLEMIRVAGARSPVKEAVTINAKSVENLYRRGGWDLSQLSNEKVKISAPTTGRFNSAPPPLTWIPRGGSAWSKSLVITESQPPANGVTFVDSVETTVTYQPKHNYVTTPAGKFLCDRICVTTVPSLEARGATRPGLQTRVSYTSLTGEYLISDEVPGLVVQYNFTTRYLPNLIPLFMHKNAHITGKLYPNAAVMAEKPDSSGFFIIEKITRP